MSSVSDLFNRVCSCPDVPPRPAAQDPSDAESSSSTGGSSSEEESSESDSKSEPSESCSSSEEERQLKLFQKRQKQTEKAREASKKSKLMKKLSKTLALKPPPSKAETFLPDLQVNCDMNKPGNSRTQVRERRQRLIWSWLKATCTAVSNLFQPVGGKSPGIAHVLGVSVMDDTNVVTSKAVQGPWQSNRVVTAMNNWQTCTVCYQKDSEEACMGQRVSFQMHTPPVILPRATAPMIWSELKGWMLGFAGVPGRKWQMFGLGQDLFSGVSMVAQLLCFDSLKTNVKVMKMLRQDIFQINAKEDPNAAASSTTHPVLGLLCSIHQLALCRNSLLFFYRGFWSSIVRLSHLFEIHNFRAQFRSALFSVLVESFQYIEVASLPESFAEWSAERKRVCNVVTTDSTYATGRLLHHLLLARVDNGECSSDTITHWCCGSRCCGGKSAEERSDFCLMLICKYFCFLFGFGFAVPLAYRWKHSQPALRWCQDSWQFEIGHFPVGVT